MAKFEPLLLVNIERELSHRLADYEPIGGYQGLCKMLAMSITEIIDIVKDSSLSGAVMPVFRRISNGPSLEKIIRDRSTVL